jgi:hypothetical protein
MAGSLALVPRTKHRLLLGREHGRTIPLPDLSSVTNIPMQTLAAWRGAHPVEGKGSLVYANQRALNFLKISSQVIGNKM